VDKAEKAVEKAVAEKAVEKAVAEKAAEKAQQLASGFFRAPGSKDKESEEKPSFFDQPKQDEKPSFFRGPLPSVMAMLGFEPAQPEEQLPDLPPMAAVEYPSLHPPSASAALAPEFPTKLPTPTSRTTKTATPDLTRLDEGGHLTRDLTHLDDPADLVEGLEPLALHDDQFVSPRESCSFARAAADENCESRPADAATVAILRLLNGSKQEMQKLRHIGEQRAEEIAQFREKHGPLTSLDQLNEIGLKAFKPSAFLDANRSAAALSPAY
jgi:hypothetical protein